MEKQFIDVYKRKELYEKVWDKPLSKVGEEYGVSSRTIRTVCEKMDIPIPGRKYRALKMCIRDSCKRVLKNKLNDYKRSQKIQHSNEVSLCVCENFLKVEDEYFVQKIDFCEEEIFIKNELLKEAIEHLSEDKFEIIICYYFFDMTDTEISKHLNLERKAVNYRRHKALEILNDFISGDFEDGESESEE